MRVCVVQFTAPSGSGSNVTLQVAVGTRLSLPFRLTYSSPTFSLLNYVKLQSGSKSEAVVLQLQGSSFGFACSSCIQDGNVSALPVCVTTSPAPRITTLCSKLACGSLAPPVRAPFVAFSMTARFGQVGLRWIFVSRLSNPGLCGCCVLSVSCQVIRITNQENSTGCTPLCVSDASGSDSYITCRSQVPIAMGSVTVSVAGLVSQPALYDYEVCAVLAS